MLAVYLIQEIPMSVQGAVYTTAVPGMPVLAAIVLPDGRVFARAVPDEATGENVLLNWANSLEKEKGIPSEVTRFIL